MYPALDCAEFHCWSNKIAKQQQKNRSLTLAIRLIGLSCFQYSSTTVTMNNGHLVAKLTDCEYFKQYHTVAPPEQEQEEKQI